LSAADSAFIRKSAAEIQHRSKVVAVERRVTEPRGMSKEQAAAYAGCESLSAFNDWVRRGIMPRPIPGTRKWDRKAIDAALDLMSDLDSKIRPQLSPYDKWKASQNADAAQRHQQPNQKTR
jgi:hypothetical protein